MSIYSQVNKPLLRPPVERGQYVSLRFGERCREIGIHRSMGSTGDCFDNAVAESFFATLEKDLLRRRSFATQQAARTAVFDYIEAFYNPIRLHSTLDYLSPIEYEQMNRKEKKAA
jgi:putative transposase